MKTVTISATDLKRNTADVLDRIAAGDDIVIERHGTPIARLTQREQRPTHAVAGERGQAWPLKHATTTNSPNR